MTGQSNESQSKERYRLIMRLIQLLAALALSGLITSVAAGSGITSDVELKEAAVRILSGYFTSLNVPLPPLEIGVSNRTMQTADGRTSLVMDLNIKVISDQPSDVIREARRHLGQELARSGYDFGDQISNGRPTVALTLHAEPALAGKDPAALRHVLTLAAIIALALIAALLFFWILLWPWRSRRRRESLMGFTVEDIPALQRSMQQVAAAKPEPAVNGAPEFFAGSDPGHVAAKPEPPMDPAISRMLENTPLEEAISILAAYDAETREAVLANLDIHEPVRRRLEIGIRQRIQELQEKAGSPAEFSPQG